MRWAAGAECRTLTTWAPVVAVAVLSQAGIGLESDWSGSDASLALTSALLAGPLLLRAARPVLTAALIGAALVVQVQLGGSLHFASFIAVLVASFATGRHAGGQRMTAGVLLLLVGVVLAVRDSLPESVEELVFPLFYVSAAAALGSVVRRQARQAAELHGLNEALVRERDAIDRLVVATERLRLARELHDVVAHTLTVAVVQAEACEAALDADLERAREAARQVQAAGRRGLADLRSLVRVLRDTDATTDEPGLDDLDTLAGVMASAGLEVTVERAGTFRGLSPELERELYRIVQEGLTNVVKHSSAAWVRILVRAHDSRVQLEIVDPGPAVESPVPSGGHGLAGMAERLAPFGGQVTAGPTSDGYRVHVSVPVHQEAPA
ncbi:histidine kinase [Nocardioides sp. SOB44]|jgi:signal transduction histidine kinase|uniref:histidine kinase n=1 Tax=Nocardioides cremeus TaxID=3058044 RepID=A0ABT8TRA7_9ACTN|nr:histidine kinase [Nocardioides cremeus]MDO3396487.1 histidine kinase [Nocardioides cremeus]